MERLTKSPRIIDLYGHCGTSIWAEAIPYEVEEYIVPGEGYIRQADLHDQDELKPQNKYTVHQKLEMALEMAEALADLHGFEDGVICVSQFCVLSLPIVSISLCGYDMPLYHGYSRFSINVAWLD
jgi:hypothetical protein